MNKPIASAYEERVAAAVAHAQQKVAAAERALIETFIREYYRQIDPEDLIARSADDLAGAALSHWELGRVRAPGALRVRVFSPSAGEHGWAVRHTVIEVVNDDMPFLVDSATMEANRQGLTLHMRVHPVYAVERDAQGRLTGLWPRNEKAGAARESWMHIEVDRLVDAPARARLAAGVERVLGDVRVVTEDWKKMLARLIDAVAELNQRVPQPASDEAAESRAFVEWLAAGNFLLLGYRCHDLVIDNGEDALKLVADSGLGILRESGEEKVSGSFAALPKQARAMAHAPTPLVILAKATARATVHRPGYVDYVGVKRFSPEGKVIGEHRFLGLLTSAAYSARVIDIPLLRGKVAAVITRAGLAPDSHLGKALVQILESYPRDEIFQIGTDELYEIAIGILRLGERQRLRLFIRRDPYERFVTCLIYVPRENYGTDLRLKFQDILMNAFAGTGNEFDVLLTDDILARILFTVRTTPGQVPSVDRRELEEALAAAARRWEDELAAALIDSEGEGPGTALYKRWQRAFPGAYRERTAARAAVADIRKLEALAPGRTDVKLYRPLGAPAGALGFKIYRHGEPVALSDSLPMLERMGVRILTEHPARARPAEVGPMWVHDFELLALATSQVEVDKVKGLFEDAFLRVFDGRVENDEFNRLVLRAGLDADEVLVLRAYAKYLRQIGFALTPTFIEGTLNAHPLITWMLVQLFRRRFEPEEGRTVDERRADSEAAAREILEALENVENLNEDRVLRQMLALIQATTRTNFWRTSDKGERRGFLSFKFDPAKVPGLPEPKPMFEIFVYSARFEGVHLRGGKVARGGLRWSDRHEDFRTEVLGLVKAQMVKNTVIVPVGSKGGFVLKKAPPATDREAYLKEGVACYQDYLRGLLDLTDNLVGGKVVPPPQVVRYDADDPYLVVAADKGTASFSDYANAISAEYGHWLGDAFASGGSAGYDHKGMGITARGAWESVKRHFREMGVDTQTTDFLCVGIGDMSGDVFGNGMLLSKHIKLVAAFDHRHIFVDPHPDPAKSWDERKRLFDLPRSSWADYDAALISEGGGVWPRSAKSIPISPQAAARLGIEATTMTPNELISAILKAPVDLLYNGGIGTYVKSMGESHADVGDRASDAIRVNGRQLRCKVVAEGGNLGCTQLGRIEYALHGCGGIGGRIYTDAIDNSAGVDTSDHEVNIKILLGLVIGEGELTEKQRNKLLAEMTDEVGTLVLRDNYYQTQALGLSKRLARPLLEQQARFIRFLEKAGRLNRALEFLPDDATLAERREQAIGLTTPESAVLLAYAKLWLFDELVASDLPEDPYVADALRRYFPAVLRERYAAYMDRHPLKREIVATYVLNSMVNRVGATFVHRLSENTGAPPAQVVRAYLLARESFANGEARQAIEALDSQVPDDVQAEMLIELARLTERATSWFLRSRRLTDPMADTIARLRPAAERLLAFLAGEPGTPRQRHQQHERWIDSGVPAGIAARVASAEAQFAALDVAEIAEQSRRSLDEVAGVYFALGDSLGLDRLRGQIVQLHAEGYWEARAKAALGDDLADLQREFAGQAVRLHAGGDAKAAVAAWAQANAHALARARRLVDELAQVRTMDLATASVALRELRNLA
jgi:glutamate dehydrogenase